MHDARKAAFLVTPLCDVRFPFTILPILIEMGFAIVGDLAVKTESELSQLAPLGHKRQVVDEACNLLYNFGLHPGMYYEAPMLDYWRLKGNSQAVSRIETNEAIRQFRLDLRYAVHIERLGMSSVTKTCLSIAGINTVKELLFADRDGLTENGQVSHRSWLEASEALARIGLAFDN